MRTAAIAIALAFAVSTLNALAEDAGGPPPAKGDPKGGGPGGGGPGGGPKQGPGGFHLLPPPVLEKLNLTAEQKDKVAALEADVKEQLAKILTPDQLQQLKQMRPPRPQGGKGGPGGGGPGGGGPGGGGQSKGGAGGGEGPRPPSE